VIRRPATGARRLPAAVALARAYLDGEAAARWRWKSGSVATRRGLTFTCAVAAAVVGSGGCGSTAGHEQASVPQARTVSIAELEARNRAARARDIASRTRRLERVLARRAAPRGERVGAVPGSLGPVAVRKMLIPFPPSREREMAAYARRHYGIDSYRLSNPKVIVEHYTGSATAQSAYNAFVPDVADSELHELPGICSHFVIDRDGTIWQLVPLDIMCRHTVGLNYTAIGIEHAGTTDQQILSNAAQLRSSLALTERGCPVARRI